MAKGQERKLDMKRIIWATVISLIIATGCQKQAAKPKEVKEQPAAKAAAAKEQPAVKAKEEAKEVKAQAQETKATEVKAKTEIKGLVGWWKLDEKEGNSVTDSSGNGFTAEAILEGEPSVWAVGEGPNKGNCAKFTGKQTIAIPDGVWDKVKDKLSIAFWVNQDPCSPPGETWPGPFGSAAEEGKSYPDSGWLPLRAFLPSPNGTVDIGKDEEHVYWSPEDVNQCSGAWNHYVFVKDTNEHTLTLYHNGVQVASSFDAMEPMPKIKGFILGGRTGPNGDWSGKLADFRIYNIALNEQDAQKLFENKGK